MKRFALEKLKEWKTKPNRKPLIIRGARQVGKTWLMKEFGRTCFENVAYVNFDSNTRMQQVFEGEISIERIVLAISAETGISIDAQNTLLIFDEVQEVPKALSSLKYFCENAPEYAIVAAGSLLGVALHKGTSFPAFVYIEEMIRLSSQEPQYYEIRVRTQLEEFWCRLLDKITAVQIEPSSHREDSARIKEMLTSTTRTITEISEMCGFSSLSYFGKIFRQHTGVTPVQYRSGL